MKKTMPVHRPAVASPDDPPGISVTNYYSELCKSSLVLAPPTLEASGDPNKILGEEAERRVLDSFGKCGRDIPGIQTICFHGVRVIGGSPSIIREVDQCCFITYQGRHYVFIMEVKCNANIKKSGGTRKKALTQLKTFTEMLRHELNIPTNGLQVHAVWPFMDPTEPCVQCGGNHASLYEKPTACQQPGTQARADPEPPGFHIFKDKFAGDNFSQWIKRIVLDPSKAAGETVFYNVLDFVARHCVGVLHDQVVKSFCFLGDDQAKLVKRPEQPLDEPTIIYGLWGTGKTITIMARIEHISEKLSAASKALYVTFGQNAIEMVKMKLVACNVDITHITFAEFAAFSHDLNKLPEDDKVVHDLVNDMYRYIYLDSVEDAGIEWVNKLLRKTLGLSFAGSCTPRQQTLPMQTSTTGDFWITLDPFQGLQDSHSLHRGSGNKLQWMGSLADTNLLEEGFKSSRIVKLQECFRMPHAMVNHLDSKKVLPTGDFPQAQDVKSLGVREVIVDLSVGYTMRWLADQLADQLFTKVQERGIHPGHCAVLFDQGVANQLFPSADGGLPTFVQLVNSKLNTMTANKKGGCMLQISQDFEETLLYSGQQTSTSFALAVGKSSSGVGTLVEETAMYLTERHAEVFQDILKTMIDDFNLNVSGGYQLQVQNLHWHGGRDQGK